MPELDFRGKEFVRNHHLTVPFRPLLPDAAKSIGDGGLDGSLIIHGDNLHALKALLPRYSGKVDCIFIDPPYNTGNEGWSYNDNVNSPLMKEWLSSNPINGEDLLRHDKWCCMMWPRLRLLKELLKEFGTIWITIDDVEVGRLRQMMDDIFGDHNFVATVCWQKKYATANDTVDFSDMHDFVLVYTNERPDSPNKKDRAVLGRLERTDANNRLYKNPDSDPRGDWRTDNYTCNKNADERPNLYYPIVHPKTGKDIWPSRTSVWRYSKDRHERNISDGRIWWGMSGDNAVPSAKRYLCEVGGTIATTWWSHEYAGHTDEAKKELTLILADRGEVFATPKPVRLIERILDLTVANNEGAVILDSFAGSGTTAHAVLNLNAKDDGNRRFILVECEEYADTVTAERVRRAINGYPFTGNQRETLFEKKLTWTEVKKGDGLRAEAENTKALYEADFDAVKIEVKDGTLRVFGERNIAETAPGLGGSFTYCTLGDAIDLDKMLSGESLPARAAMAEWLLYVAGVRLTDAPVPETDDAALREWYLGRDEDVCYWLVYRPDKPFLLSREAALTLDMARRLKQFDRQRKHLVFAPAKYVSRKLLVDEKLPVEYANIPFSLFRLERD